MTIEPIMYSAIGFLAAALAALICAPLIHGRAVRLTLRRLEAAIPTSINEIKADKDHLRADFSMATRRLELTIERLKTQSVAQKVEVGKKDDGISRLRADLGEKAAVVVALEAREKSLRDQLLAAEEEILFKTNAMHFAERARAENAADLAKLSSEYARCSKIADAQTLELISLRTQVEAIKARDELLLYVMGKHAAVQGEVHYGMYRSIGFDDDRPVK